MTTPVTDLIRWSNIGGGVLMNMVWAKPTTSASRSAASATQSSSPRLAAIQSRIPPWPSSAFRQNRALMRQWCSVSSSHRSRRASRSASRAFLTTALGLSRIVVPYLHGPTVSLSTGLALASSDNCINNFDQ